MAYNALTLLSRFYQIFQISVICKKNIEHLGHLASYLGKSSIFKANSLIKRRESIYRRLKRILYISPIILNINLIILFNLEPYYSGVSRDLRVCQCFLLPSTQNNTPLREDRQQYNNYYKKTLTYSFLCLQIDRQLGGCSILPLSTPILVTYIGKMISEAV